MAGSEPMWKILRDAISGDVILPGAPGYASARSARVGGFDDIRPRAVVRCASAADVAMTVAFVRRSGLPLAVRAGGHCFAGRSSTRGALVDLSRMRSVAVDLGPGRSGHPGQPGRPGHPGQPGAGKTGGTVTTGPGALLGDVYEHLGAQGLTIPAGCGRSVGIAGLTLGGGFGVLGRTHGLTSDNLLSAQVVLAGGGIVGCDGEHHPDLFWALRGAGGGQFGVVTSLVLRAVPAPPSTAFHLTWPSRQAVAVLKAWQAAAPDAPDALAASLLITADGSPNAVHEQPAVHVSGAAIGTGADATGLLEDLVTRCGTDPTSAVFRHGPYRGTKRMLSGLFDDPAGDEVPRAGADLQPVSRSEFFARSLPPDAVAALVDGLTADPVPGQARELDFSPWGGAYTRMAVDATAFAHRDARFVLKHTATIDADAPLARKDAARRWSSRSWAIAHPWGTGGVYPNFPDPLLEDPGRAYHGANLERLCRVKAAYDPHDVFRFPQSLPVTTRD